MSTVTVIGAEFNWVEDPIFSEDPIFMSTPIELKINRAGVPILVVQQLVANAEVTSSHVPECI